MAGSGWRGPMDARMMFETLSSDSVPDAMHFEVSRDVPARQAGFEAADGVSFSEEAMRDLFVAVETFIGARLYARMAAGEGPVKMKVGIDLKFDDWAET